MRKIRSGPDFVPSGNKESFLEEIIYEQRCEAWVGVRQKLGARGREGERDRVEREVVGREERGEKHGQRP